MLILIMNGIEAMTAISDRPRILTIISGPAEAGGIMIAVEDTGPGIDPADADRIFEPFFTTKEPGQGMGLGLFLTRNVIERLGGTLKLSSTLSQGTTAEVTLPKGESGEWRVESQSSTSMVEINVRNS